MIKVKYFSATWFKCKLVNAQVQKKKLSLDLKLLSYMCAHNHLSSQVS